MLPSLPLRLTALTLTALLGLMAAPGRPALAGGAAGPEATIEAVADRARTKIVVLKVERGSGSERMRSAGTGFLAGTNLVVTAGHVVAEADRVTAWVNGVSYPATVVGRHPEVDLAALRLRAPELLLKPVQLAVSTEDLERDEALLVLAGPSQGPRATGDPATRALISAQYSRRIHLQGLTGKPTPMVAMKASVRKGDSGSPVLRVKDGTVVGVLSSRALPDASGVSLTAYAVPVDLLHGWLRALPAAPQEEDFYLKRR